MPVVRPEHRAGIFILKIFHAFAAKLKTSITRLRNMVSVVDREFSRRLPIMPRSRFIHFHLRCLVLLTLTRSVLKINLYFFCFIETNRYIVCIKIFRPVKIWMLFIEIQRKSSCMYIRVFMEKKNPFQYGAPFAF